MLGWPGPSWPKWQISWHDPWVNFGTAYPPSKSQTHPYELDISLELVGQLQKDPGQSTLVTVAFRAAPRYWRFWMPGAVKRLLPRWGMDLHFPNPRGSPAKTMPLA